MSASSRRIHLPPLVPELDVLDLDASLAFYVGKLGFEVANVNRLYDQLANDLEHVRIELEETWYPAF